MDIPLQVNSSELSDQYPKFYSHDMLSASCKLLTTPRFVQKQCHTEELRFLVLCFYLWLVCLYSFLLQRPVLSPPAPF